MALTIVIIRLNITEAMNTKEKTTISNLTLATKEKNTISNLTLATTPKKTFNP